MDTLSNAELTELGREDLIKRYIELQANYNNILLENAQLKEALDNINQRFVKLESVVEEPKTKKDDKLPIKKVIELEKKIYANQQYSRRDCVEIVGIDETIGNEDLESKVIDILGDINVTTSPTEIQAVHRLYDGKRTICKFMNRKTVTNILRNRKLLGSLDEYKKKIYVNESLCPYYRFLHGKCKALWRLGKIHGFAVVNGSVRYRMDDGGNLTKIEHLDDLQNVFGEICL